LPPLRLLLVIAQLSSRTKPFPPTSRDDPSFVPFSVWWFHVRSSPAPEDPPHLLFAFPMFRSSAEVLASSPSLNFASFRLLAPLPSVCLVLTSTLCSGFLPLASLVATLPQLLPSVPFALRATRSSLQSPPILASRPFTSGDKSAFNFASSCPSRFLSAFVDAHSLPCRS